jgi:hypothetical protein
MTESMPFDLPGPVKLALLPPLFGADGHAGLVAELKRLRKGRGLFTNGIGDRIGPALREVCGIDPADGPVAIRNKVANRLTHLADALPADLRTAVLIAFAIASDARQPLYKDRVVQTAARIQRDPRTARRRIDEAIEQLAQLATDHTQVSDLVAARGTGRWHTNRLLLSLALDHDHPELVELGQVVADHHALTEIETVAAHAAATSGPAPAVAVLYGGVVTPGSDVLQLPAPLSQGDEHSYALRALHSGSPLTHTALTYTPANACRRLDLHVRFHRMNPPRRITQIGNITRDLPVDRAGEVHVRFTDLTAGNRHGLLWQW